MDVARTAADGACLLVEVAGRRVALGLRHVRRVIPMLATDPVPGGPPGLGGFANLAGAPVPVLWLRALFGLDAAPVEEAVDHKIVVCEVDGRAVGFVVDETVGLCEVDGLRSPRADDHLDVLESVAAVGVVDGRLCAVLDPARVLGSVNDPIHWVRRAGRDEPPVPDERAGAAP